MLATYVLDIISSCDLEERTSKQSSNYLNGFEEACN